MLPCIFVLFLCCHLTYGALSHPDEILDLPGLPSKPNFRQYSGYLNASSGKYLHYWFVESQKSPSSDPLVLWMNGGPGCSSLDGFLTELGPFHVQQDGKTLYYNSYSWNKVANVIFLEAPAGVGYSYSDDQKYETDDDTVSQDNYLALQHFFVKYPEFKKNDFYITGESYGGIYVPTLSVRVLTEPASINFKGFAVGNGFLDQRNLSNSIVFFAYYHGLLGKELWNNLESYCCTSSISPETCDFTSNCSINCSKAVFEVARVITTSGLNIYNLYEDCSPSALSKNSRLPVDRRNMFRFIPLINKVPIPKEAPPCIDVTNVTTWLNQKTVRDALHIPSNVQDWTICSPDVQKGYQNLYSTMKPQVLKLIQSGQLRGLIYNGDVDMACNFLGDEWFADSLQLPVIEHYREWTFNEQIAGFVKRYQNLTFLTVKGSGHMVPQDKPGPAFKMISSFLYNKDY
uniref:Carboxypeptidase n=1 Tax=Liphistius sp. SGP-2016 TaxID=1905180 RepID=A0A4Q8K548_9ARAC